MASSASNDILADFEARGNPVPSGVFPRHALRRKVTLENDRDLARELGLVLGRDPDDELVPLLEAGVLEIALDHETVVAGHEAFVRPDPGTGGQRREEIAIRGEPVKPHPGLSDAFLP